jgi:leucyl/phenylalanyl-tRNA---protein transferase
MTAPLPAIDLDVLMRAYARGIFPMADSRSDAEVYWVEPRQRGILPLDQFHLSKSLAKRLKTDEFSTTADAAFDAVSAPVRRTVLRHGGGASWLVDCTASGWAAPFLARACFRPRPMRQR